MKLPCAKSILIGLKPDGSGAGLFCKGEFGFVVPESVGIVLKIFRSEGRKLTLEQPCGELDQEQQENGEHQTGDDLVSGNEGIKVKEESPDTCFHG